MQATTPVTGCDPWQMALIHRLIRRGFEQARRCVLASPDPSPERVAALTEYLQFHLDGLHAHHSTEDELLWPELRARARMAGSLVDRMEGQHAAIHRAIEDVSTGLDAWRTDPDGTKSTALAQAIETLLGRLEEHLGEEERDVVPHIAEHITEQEWDNLGKAAFAKFTPQQRFTAMGEMLAAATPDEATQMMSGLPLPIRVVWRLVGARKYERSMARLQA